MPISAAVDGRAEIAPDAPVIVIGGGQGGIGCAVALREEGHGGSITVVGNEGEGPYQRPPLTKDYLLGKVNGDHLSIHGETAFHRLSIDGLWGETVERLDLAGRSAVLATGLSLPYEHAVLATGARNRSLPTDDPTVMPFSLRTREDADRLRDALAGAPSVLVIGGGLIGLEIAAAARTRNCEVTVVEAAPELLHRHVSRGVAAHLERLHRQRGVELLVGVGVELLVTDGQRVIGARTSAGDLFADVVVDATGVTPVVDVAKTSGLTIEQGVATDGYLRTSDPSVSAIGDCSSHLSVWSGGARVRIESVQNATDQGAYVARRLLGMEAAPYQAVPWFWSDQFGVRVQMVGMSRPEQRTIVGPDHGDGKFSVYCYADDRLVRVESVASPGEHLAARRVLTAGASPELDLVAHSEFSLKEWWQSQKAAICR